MVWALLACALCVPAAPSLLVAQTPLPLQAPISVPGVTYRSDVPTPEQVLGHEIGARHTRPHEIVEYVRAVAEASPRVVMGEYGHTYEHRPLVYAVVTSPENHARLEEIRQANLRLSDAPETVSDAELAEMPVVVNLHYSVHGNEASGAEAALVMLYHLAAGEGEAVASVLENAVVVLDPLINPDGRDRFVDWVNANRGGVPTRDTQDREHNEPWPNGRTNHYLFDLNRDWLPLQHPESQGRLRLFHHWRPQLLIDAHEMGGDATFFFQPGIPSRDNPNTPPETFDLARDLAAFHAEQLDAIGSLYYSEESFDDFYYGKGSTYPDINGAVGLLFEQGSTRALETETTSGAMTYAFTIRNQVAASLSTLRGAVAMRERFLGLQRGFYADVPELYRESPVKAYVFSLEGDRTRAQAMAQLLRRHRIRLYELAEPVTADGATYAPGAAYVVPLDQAQHRLIKAMMERVTTFRDSLFYDVSTWTIPLAFGVDHAALDRDPDRWIGEEIEAMPFDGGRLVGGRSGYAYLMEWGRYFGPRALYRLLAAGITPRVAMEPFELAVDGRMQRFGRGTIVIPVVQRDPDVRLTADDVHALVERIVEEDHVVVHAVGTGLTPVGVDLGGPSTEPLARPRIAIAAGPGTAAYAVGEAWHLLSERFRIPVSLVDVEDFGSVDLDRYTVLVLPRGSYGTLGNGAIDQIREWTRAGGALIAMESAVALLVNQEIVGEELRVTDAPPLDPAEVPYAEVDRVEGAQVLGGSIFEARLDLTHPLAFGYDAPRVPLFRAHETLLEPSDTPGATVARYTDNPLMSGYIAEELLDDVAGAAAVVARELGDGRVMLIHDNPNFRAFWYGTNPLFLNAVFFGRIF